MNVFDFTSKEVGLGPPARPVTGDARSLARRKASRLETGRATVSDPSQGDHVQDRSFARELEKARKGEVEAPLDATTQAPPAQSSEPPQEPHESGRSALAGVQPEETSAGLVTASGSVSPAKTESKLQYASLALPGVGTPAVGESQPALTGQAGVQLSAAAAGGEQADVIAGVIPVQPVITGQPQEAMAEAAPPAVGPLPAGNQQATAEPPAPSQAEAGSQPAAPRTLVAGLQDAAGSAGEQATAVSGKPPAQGPQVALVELKAGGQPTQPDVELQATPAAGGKQTSGGSSSESAQSETSNPEANGQAGASAYNPVVTVLPAIHATLELARLAEARPGEFVERLSQEIAGLKQSGQNTLRLQLHPEELGKIDLRVSSGESGLRVVLTASQSSTTELLERHLPDLRQALEEAGIQLAGLSVGAGSSQESPDQSGRWAERSAFAGLRRAAAGLPADVPASANSLHRSLSPNGLEYWV